MRLITFLGTGNYSETCYKLGENECRTRYVAAALATFLKANSIVVLATEQAYESHASGLAAELEKMNLPTPEVRRIPSGGSNDELWKQFEVISAAVTDDNPEAVSFDITHGFRAQPFFAAAVISYLESTLDKVPNMQAFYGEWRKDESTSPIWDTSAFINLLDWSSALQGFMKTGHGAALAQLAKSENASIQRAGLVERPRKLASLAESIKAFSDNIATVRIPQIITGGSSDRGSAANVLQAIDLSEAEVKKHFMPLYPTLETLKSRLEKIPADSLFSINGHTAMLALARLYVDYERYPEAAIVVREGWVSLYSDSENKTDEEQLKWDIRNAMEASWSEAEGASSPERIADQVRNVRNDIQHGGFKEKSARNPANSLIRDLQALVQKFDLKLSLMNSNID